MKIAYILFATGVGLVILGGLRLLCNPGGGKCQAANW
jgi:hypothetical protein